MFLQVMYLLYMYTEDLSFDNPQWSICHKTQTNYTKLNFYNKVNTSGTLLLTIDIDFLT